MKTKRLPMIVCAILLLIIILCCLFVPQYVLEHQFESQLNALQTAPAEYYRASRTTLAKKASQMLSPIDRINLTTGTLKSTYAAVDYDENASLPMSEAAELAKMQIEHYYQNGVYPYSLKSDYDNWYTYHIDVYSYTDRAFNTYSANMLKITFEKYDNSLTHTILMTEDGAILAAIVSEAYVFNTSIDSLYREESGDVLFADPSIYVSSILPASSLSLPRRIETVYPQLPLESIFKQNCFFISATSEDDTQANYYVFQYTASNSYGIGLLPARFVDTIKVDM